MHLYNNKLNNEMQQNIYYNNFIIAQRNKNYSRFNLRLLIDIRVHNNRQNLRTIIKK